MADPVRAAARAARASTRSASSLSLDDFGTGYSSLSRLRELPISEIKIDRSFAARIETDERDVAIMRSTIELGHNLGCSVVAEGLETAEALERRHVAGLRHRAGLPHRAPARRGRDLGLAGCSDRGSIGRMAIATSEQSVVDSVPHQLYIGGEWRDGSAAARSPVEDPATGETLAEVADATPEDAEAALHGRRRGVQGLPQHGAARARRDPAPRLRPDHRAPGRPRAADDARDGQAASPSRKAEIVYAANFFRWYSRGGGAHQRPLHVNENGKGRVLTMQQPVGPCVFITPWNFPLAMGTRKVGPAIAAGCTMVVKPAKQTPLSMLAMAQILEEAGLPGGVVQRHHGEELGRADGAADPDPRDAQAVVHRLDRGRARSSIEQAAEQLLRMSMELGGNAPFLVFEDADLDLAVEGAMLAKMRNIGEACTSANRFHVHESVADEFAERLAERMGALKVGARHRGRRRRSAR